MLKKTTKQIQLDQPNQVSPSKQTSRINKPSPLAQLNQPIISVKGIGEKLAAKLNKKNLHTVADLLLLLPIRYEDRSKLTSISNWQENELISIKAQLNSITSYYKNRLLITRATINDGQNQASCFWFNNKFVKQSLKLNQDYYFSGKIGKNKTLMQPVYEAVKEKTLHTNRLVPIYSSSVSIKQGILRRLFNEMIENLPDQQTVDSQLQQKNSLFKIGLRDIFQHLHFPDKKNEIIAARERLALEELIQLILHSWQLKKTWQANNKAHQIQLSSPKIPNTIPFSLTQAQERSINEILEDLEQNYPMNRILVGDVGSGKTVVAGAAIYHCLANNHHACLVAPTKILAHQHKTTFNKIFPRLSTKLLTAQNKINLKKISQPTLFIGTHALINKLNDIKPALLIYDEQHRFGVKQRSEAKKLAIQPHLLTMTATPIPRSLMLTIFSHLNISYLDQMPPGRKKPQTHLVAKHKTNKAYKWLFEQLNKNPKNLAIIICPFIDPSADQALENVEAVSQLYQNLQTQLKKYKEQQHIKPALLHSRLKKQDQKKLINQLFEQKINLLVATPIVEVGIDLPQANIMFIKSAERFGLASLHQLRGRVGRAGQKSFCFLFASNEKISANKRLKLFSKIDDGNKLAEIDLKSRGAGNIFGTNQHGFSDLKFASWANLDLISQANQLAQLIKKNKLKLLFLPILEKNKNLEVAALAN